MKKIIVSILLLLGMFTLLGCDGFNFGNGNQIDVGDETPTAVLIANPSGKYSLAVGESIDLNASVSPDTAPQTVIWSSNNNEVAQVTQDGVVTGIKEGNAKITAVSTEAEVSGYVYLTVVKAEIELTGIEITPFGPLHIDETVKLEVTKTPAAATAELEWTSSNENIITVDGNGRITGKQIGSAVITVSYKEISDSVTITVEAREGTPIQIIINGRNSIDVDEQIRLKVLAVPTGSINSVIWSSSDEEVATVSEEGIVTGIASGTVQITAVSNQDDTITDSFEIEVFDRRINQENLQQNVIDVIAYSKDSIFGVSNYKRNPVTGGMVKESIGSGTVYKVWFELEDGSLLYDINEIFSFDEVKKFHYYLMTNRHVVLGADQLKIYLHTNDQEIDATLMQYDDKVDLAVVYFTYDEYIRPLKIADSSSLQAGHFAVAIGNPSGYEFSSSATFGIISHPKRHISDDTDGDGVNDWDSEYIQHDVAINPGNSGGPLLNMQGEIIGMNTLKFAATDIDNMGFSIPSNVISDLLPILEAGEKPKRALLGVQILVVRDLLLNPNPEFPLPEGVTYGVYVDSVVPGGVADKAGVLPEDIILSFNGIDIVNSITLRTELGKIVVGSNQEIPIGVLRNGITITLTLVF